jgi:hypothetical protein
VISDFEFNSKYYQLDNFLIIVQYSEKLVRLAISEVPIVKWKKHKLLLLGGENNFCLTAYGVGMEK